MATKKKADSKPSQTTNSNTNTTTTSKPSAAAVPKTTTTKQVSPPSAQQQQQSEKVSSKLSIVAEKSTVDESKKNVKQQQTSKNANTTITTTPSQNNINNKPVASTSVNSNATVVTNDSSNTSKKKKQKSSDTTTANTTTTTTTTTPVVATPTAVQSKNNNNNTTTVTVTPSSSSNNENVATPISKKKKKKSSSSESTNTQSVNGTVEIVATKNNPSPNTSITSTSSSVTTSPTTTVASDIATTAQPSPIVKTKRAHNPGKDDNSLSAWLCRAYFAIGLLIAWNLCFIVVLPMYICHILFGFDRNKSLMGWLFRYFNRWAVETNPFWNIKTFYANGSTKNRLPKKQKKVIFICNHQSGMDPFILISALPIEAKWVAKHIIFKIPIAGWLMSMIGDVPIVFTSKKAEHTTTDKSSVTRALDTLRNYLNNDCAVFFFPEGRRSDNPDEFLEFRKGAFVMALQTGADIIPMAISGSHTIWELKHKLPRPGRCAIVVGDPISVKGMTLENDVDNLLQKSRKAVEDLYQIAKKKAKSLK
ncbi:predicted protein [Naegleria gruberi]|uniref:Predicted protein n=1 Tax=Naegleria gruberi TaxID=5762 RepID=D2VB95_NAEGR|nr:uncharacterized protein NAEGRDRAFT_66137 [Naegleria gruberi]EFC45869.1 predicted protein [Naegleria gruberi]|eukprot:XP_002678613.1 predicted protein [Naegleria gruberi strain NEG-M]